MPIEIESKVAVESFDAVVERLGALGADHVADMLECNVFFDRPDASLRLNDRGLRVRSIVESSGRASCVMTHKGPRRPGKLKLREEIELEVASVDDAAAMLAALGYEPMLRFEKRRSRYALAGCRVELDELPHIGRFVEVEGPSESAVVEVQGLLGLDGREPVTEGYAAMLRAYLDRHGLDVEFIRFEAGAAPG